MGREIKELEFPNTIVYLSGRGGDTIAKKGGASENLTFAQSQLENYLNRFRKVDPIKNRGLKNSWRAKWDADYAKYGSEALITLFPRDADRDVRHIKIMLRNLAKTNGSPHKPIITKDDLLNTTRKRLLVRDWIGPKTADLTDRMRNVILAERALQEERQ